MTNLDDKNIDPSDPKYGPLLEKLQGNILKGHGRDRTVHIFFQFEPGASIERRKALIRYISDKVTSAMEQFQQELLFKTNGDKKQTFMNLFLSARGYEELQFDQAGAPSDALEQPPIPPQVTFNSGMAAYRSELGDTLATWERGYVGPSGEVIIDGMILIANDDEALLGVAEQSIVDQMKGVATVLVTENGQALFNANGTENLEHFGYVDGRSQPTFLKDQRLAEQQQDGVDRWDPAEPLSLVLVPDPLANDPDAFGSYFVFRKLEQDVAGFEEAEQEFAAQLGLEGDERALAGAMAVGRFKDGTPVALHSANGFIDPIENNFRFDQADPHATKCPFHAHIRKMSPRGDTQVGGAISASNEVTERSHRIARRGITFGKRASISDPPDGPVGLLFMCFQSLIDNQFAFMQRAWANNSGFSRGLFGDPRRQTGLDPVIGQGSDPAPAQLWPSPWGSLAEVSLPSFSGFVTNRGGEFFFAPSLPFLRSL